jgi:hypothetical protein
MLFTVEVDTVNTDSAIAAIFGCLEGDRLCTTTLSIGNL